MLLDDYLITEGISRKRFAEQIGVVPSYITALCNGVSSPGPDVMRRIVEETNGAVTPQDFLDQPRSGPADGGDREPA